MSLPYFLSQNLRKILKPRLGLQFKDDMTYIFPSSVVHTTSSPSHGRDSSWLITKHSWEFSICQGQVHVGIRARRKKEKKDKKKDEPLASGKDRDLNIKHVTGSQILFVWRRRAEFVRWRAGSTGRVIGMRLFCQPYNDKEATMRDLYYFALLLGYFRG